MKFLIATCTIGALVTTGATAAAASAPALPTARHFANCDAMHRVYPHGVGLPHAHDHTTNGDPVTKFKRSRPLYRANRGSDADGDHIACEEH